MVAAFDQSLSNLIFDPVVDFFACGLPVRRFAVKISGCNRRLPERIPERVSVVDRSHPCRPVLFVSGGGDVQILSGFQIHTRHHEVQLGVALVPMQHPRDVERVGLLSGEHEILEILDDLFQLLTGRVVVEMEGEDTGSVFPATVTGIDQITGQPHIPLEQFGRDFPAFFPGQILLDGSTATGSRCKCRGDHKRPRISVSRLRIAASSPTTKAMFGRRLA